MGGKKKTPWFVFLAILLAVLWGSFLGKEASLFGVVFYDLFESIGKLFLKALTLVVVPLVSSSIISGVARIGGDGSFGRLGAKMFGFYLGTSLLAILIGLCFVNLLAPGEVIQKETISMAQSANAELIQKHIVNEEAQKVSDVIAEIIPANVFDAFAKGQLLGVIFFSLLFGYCASKIPKTYGTVLLDFWQAVFQTMLRITHVVMKFLPLGVFCLVANVFATTGVESFLSLGIFTLSVVLGLVTFVFVALPLLLKFWGRVSPRFHFRAMSPALVTAFSTSSSSATLPVTMDCVEKRAGVSNRICSLVIPLGTSINMSGSALYECVAAIFVAQAYGIELSFATQFLVVLLALITSIGVAGIPSASLVAIIVILKAIGLPTEGIGLFIAVDRILDMCRTTVNVFSDSCCAVLVARSEGEKNVLQLDPNKL